MGDKENRGDGRKLRTRFGGIGEMPFRARVFAALVGISAVTSLVIGLVLFYFAENRLVAAESDLLAQRSQTANAGAREFLTSLRDPETGDFPPAEEYAEQLVRSVASPTGLGVLYVGPGGEPLAAWDVDGEAVDPEAAYRRTELNDDLLRPALEATGNDGRRVSGGEQRFATVWPLRSSEGVVRGAMVYTAPQEELDETLSYLQFGILGSIGASVVLASLASYVLTRQITRPLSETRDAAIRIASGDYGTTVPVERDDELGELGRAFNFMAAEVEHFVGEIREQKSRLEAVLEASPEALVATDAEGRITMANPAADRMLGVRAAHHGRSLRTAATPEGVLLCLREAAATGVAVREVELGEKSYWVYAARMGNPTGNPLGKPEEPNGNAGGNVKSVANGNTNGAAGAGMILAVRDITEHRSLERARTDFLSDVSHELRTPLTTIQSAVDLLGRARERLDPLEGRALELAEGELVRIRGMVEELLVLSRMDSWQYSLEVGPSDLADVVRSAVSAVETKAERFGIAVHLQEVEGRVRLACDPQKLYQVFLNLLDNAIKYSDPGSRVEVRLREEDDAFVVEVEDTGTGIPEEDLPHLFERFYRVSKDRSRATGGTGLGLAIAHQIVDMHGGEISVDSTFGQGSTFRVRLLKTPLPRSANYAM